MLSNNGFPAERAGLRCGASVRRSQASSNGQVGSERESRGPSRGKSAASDFAFRGVGRLLGYPFPASGFRPNTAPKRLSDFRSSACFSGVSSLRSSVKNFSTTLRSANGNVLICSMISAALIFSFSLLYSRYLREPVAAPGAAGKSSRAQSTPRRNGRTAGASPGP